MREDRGEEFDWLNHEDFDVGRVQFLEVIPRDHCFIAGLDDQMQGYCTTIIEVF